MHGRAEATGLPLAPVVHAQDLSLLPTACLPTTLRGVATAGKGAAASRRCHATRRRRRRRCAGPQQQPAQQPAQLCGAVQAEVCNAGAWREGWRGEQGQRRQGQRRHGQHQGQRRRQGQRRQGHWRRQQGRQPRGGDVTDAKRSCCLVGCHRHPPLCASDPHVAAMLLYLNETSGDFEESRKAAADRVANRRRTQMGTEQGGPRIEAAAGCADSRRRLLLASWGWRSLPPARPRTSQTVMRKEEGSALLAQIHLLGDFVHLVHHAVDDAGHCSRWGTRQGASVGEQAGGQAAQHRSRDTCRALAFLHALGAARVPPPGRLHLSTDRPVKTPPMTAQMAVRNLYSCLGCSVTTI